MTPSLADIVRTADPATLQRYAAGLDDDDLAMLEQTIAEITGEGWRAHPAAMAAHLTKGESDEYQRWPYIELLSKSFAAGIRGEDPRQIWNIPSQYGKTTALLTYGVPWALDHDPSLRIIYITYDANKAAEEGGKARDFIEKHADVLRCKLRPDRRARGMWGTEGGGGLYCVGVNGGIVGWPADVAICDDLIKGWAAGHSEAIRDHAWNVYRSQIRLRMQSPRDPIFLVGTRWHEQDPTGKALESEVDPAGIDRWRLIRLPALAEAAQPDSPNVILRDPDPLGRAEGEPLEPRRFSLDEVVARATILQSYLAAGLEQQRPAPEEGNDIKREWWVIDDMLPAVFDNALSSWDMKLKEKESGDFVVGQVWGRTGSDFWCLAELRGQWNQATTRAAIALVAVRFPSVKRHVIENTGYGPEVMSMLRAGSGVGYDLDPEIAGQLGMTEGEADAVQTLLREGMPGLIPNNPRGDKRVRARAVTPLIEARNCHLPAHAPWVAGFLEELSSFPNGAFDDRVDAMSQALSKLSTNAARISVPGPQHVR